MTGYRTDSPISSDLSIPTKASATAALAMLSDTDVWRAVTNLTPAPAGQGWGKGSLQFAGMLAAGAASTAVWSMSSELRLPMRVLAAAASSGTARTVVQGGLENLLLKKEDRTSVSSEFAWGMVDGLAAVIGKSYDERLALRGTGLFGRGVLTGAGGAAAWSTPHALFDHKTELGSAGGWLHATQEVGTSAVGGAMLGGVIGGAASYWRRADAPAIFNDAAPGSVAAAEASEFKFASGALTELETPAERAAKLGLAADFEQSKEIFFARARNSDGTVSDVVVRPFNPAQPSSLMRADRAQVEQQVNAILSDSTGLKFPSVRSALRDNVELPTFVGSDRGPSVSGMAFIQENGGKQFGTQVKEWAAVASGKQPNAAFEPGSVKRLMDSNPDAQHAIGTVMFDNMWKGNIDLTELSQQTIPRGTVRPGDVFDTVTVDAKNNFSLLQAPTWGYGSQYGMTLDVAKALEGKSLSSVSPALQSRAEVLRNALTLDTVRNKLMQTSLTQQEIEAASARLANLQEHGFPKHLGETVFSDESGNVTASLTGTYDTEAEAVQLYLKSRNDGLMVIKTGDSISLRR